MNDSYRSQWRPAAGVWVLVRERAPREDTRTDGAAADTISDVSRRLVVAGPVPPRAPWR